jgi:hypothetical protein
VGRAIEAGPRKGKDAGKNLMVNEQSERPIRYVKVEVGECLFPEAGLYSKELLLYSALLPRSSPT